MFEVAVLALDASDSSDRAYEFATRLAARHGTRFHVVHVVEIVPGRGAGPLRLDEQERTDRIRAQVDALKHAGAEAELEIHSAIGGGPAHVIAEVADRTGADVIITGTRGHTAAAGIVVGSVTHRLLHVAHCPLLVIPQKVVRSVVETPLAAFQLPATAALAAGS